MSYFADQYNRVRYPIADAGPTGLRNAQVGGIHAVAAHFTLSKLPAIIVMPTGSGKTAVLCLTPYLKRADRVLVVTPSRLVRNQIAEEVAGLLTLKEIGVFAADVPPPMCHELTERVKTPGEWDALREYDVVVATPNAISPAYEGVPQPPADLFDLLLVDEAHHEPAKTWRELLSAFPDAARVLFTATPYRQDGRDIRGRLAYAYPLKRAYEDGIFGKLRYVPVDANGGSHDVATAKKAEEVFLADRAAGLRHYLMVRTDQKTRAKQLEKVYADHTGLRLRTISSDHSYQWVRRTIEHLRGGDLDGVICVDMMGEGFDFPNLKVAAIHSPHKSLSVTLQFIGRFARTNAPDIGDAKFVAVPTDVGGEIDALFKEGAVWQELVTDLAGNRLTEEQDAREVIEAFGEPVVADPKAGDISLYSLWPFCHVKIYKTPVDVNIASPVTLPPPFEVHARWVDAAHRAAVVISNEQQNPRWTDLPDFNRSEYDLFVVYHDPDTKLLFINASRRSTALYEELAEQYTGGRHRILPLCRINRVLRGIENPEFFNIGMKNRVTNPNAESYRIYTGRRAEQAVDEADARLNHRGHVFGKGVLGGKAVTIGYSSASKVWSNTNCRIPALIDWCRTLAKQIASDEPMAKIPGLDLLTVGEEIGRVPDGVIAAEWHPSAYKAHIKATYKDATGEDRECELTDLDLEVDRAATDAAVVTLVVRGDGIEWRARFDLAAFPHLSPADPPAPGISLTRGHGTERLIDHLNNYLPSFYCADFSMFRGAELFAANPDREPFPAESLAVIDWHGAGVNIEKEFWKDSDERGGKVCIHDHLCQTLNADPHRVVVYDHGTGEVADVLTFQIDNDHVLVRLYHVKGSSDTLPGERVEDVYQVCGQVIKSLIWLKRDRDLQKKLRERFAKGSKCVRGDKDEIDALFIRGRETGFRYQMVIVQPGVSKKKFGQKLGEVLAAAAHYLKHAGAEKLLVLASA